MPTFRSPLGYEDYCRELLYSSETEDVRFCVAGSGVSPLPGHKVVLSLLCPSMHRMIKDPEVDLGNQM